MSYLVQIIGTALTEIRNIQLNKISAEIGVKFAKEMMYIICNMEYKEFKNNSETIINSIHKTLVGLDRINRWVIGNILSNLIEITLISFSLSSYLGRKYFLFTFITYGIYISISRRISLHREKLFRERKRADLASENKLIDIVNNIQTVKYFSGEYREAESYSKLISIVKDKDTQVLNSLALLNSTQSMILNSGIMFNITACVRDCLKGKMTPGDLFLLQGVFTQLMLPLHIIGVLMKELEESKIHLNYGIKLQQKRQLQLENNMNKKQFKYKQGLIEMKNVSFDYSKNASVLKGMNAIFEPGKINCVMGESGQGKSTLFDLIYKLFSPKEGQIFIDGQDIFQCNTESVRKHLTICPQNGYLFNESIKHNILYGNPSLSDNDLIEALENVNLFTKIMKLKNKWLANVGTLGGKLSGGERQRLIFARSLIKNGDIILLDEPTSNLDAQNENDVFDLIRKTSGKKKTVIICAHKLSTIAKCDKIFMLNKGEIKECGSHEELMLMKGNYYNIITKQTAIDSLKLH